MTDKPERGALLCMPYLGAFAPADSVPGSYTMTADCGHQVWMSPQGAVFLEQHDLLTICFHCRPDPRKVNGVKAVPGSFDAVAELSDKLEGEGAGDQFRAKMRDVGLTEYEE